MYFKLTGAHGLSSFIAAETPVQCQDSISAATELQKPSAKLQLLKHSKMNHLHLMVYCNKAFIKTSSAKKQDQQRMLLTSAYAYH